MATTILPFIIRPETQGKKRATGGEATVIIFPGVRYETRAVEKERRRSKRSDSATRGKGKSKAQ